MIHKLRSLLSGKGQPQSDAAGDGHEAGLGPTADLAATHAMRAVRESMATIEFLPDGTIDAANDLFLGVVGYAREAVVGQHHRMFVDREYAESPAYRDFWAGLRDGVAQSAAFSRRARDGSCVWIQATYMPVRDDAGKIVRILKIAADITKEKHQQQLDAAMLLAIDKSQAVVEFTPDGTVQRANENFLQAMCYRSDQVVGQHHRLFVPADERSGADYQAFWADLAGGAAQQGEFRRINSRGEDVWIQGSYTPIHDAQGGVSRVVKLAIDNTENKQREGIERAARSIADSLNELASAAGEISERVSSSATLTSGVAGCAKEASHRVATLGEASGQISNVVDVIRDLADQTNLLALNATIEAARAGEAGRGFAVVASEVKDLAVQTNVAVAEIKEQIDAIQSNVESVAESVGGMAKSSEQVGENGLEMAAAVEEQSAIIVGLRDQSLGLLQSGSA